MPSEEKLRGLVQRYADAHEHDRVRVARALHDELGQTLTLLRMNCSWLVEKVPEMPASATGKLQAVLRLADDAIRTTRRLSGELRPGILDFGIAAAIEWQTEEFGKKTGIRCRTDVCEDEDLTSPAVATELYRIFQEALLNVERHAAATDVGISLKRVNSQLVLEVQDNGTGITDDQAAGLSSLGILDMRERATRTGAAFSIQGNPGQGTVLKISLAAEPARQ